MKRNASLILLELVIMLLVFALAAALCLQAFVWADSQSRHSGRVDAAYIHIQNAAEVLKHHRGNYALAAKDLGGQWDGESWIIYYDDNWQITDTEFVFCLRVEPLSSETEHLGTAQLTVTDSDGSVLAQLTVSWQEVAP